MLIVDYWFPRPQVTCTFNIAALSILLENDRITKCKQYFIQYTEHIHAYLKTISLYHINIQ